MAGGFLSSSNLNNVSMTDISRDLSYRCISASLPGMTLKTADVNRFGLGVQEKMPYSGNFTDISLTFLCDKFGAAYNFWYSWLSYIFTMNGQVTSGANPDQGRPFYTTEYKDNYAATIIINVYDPAGEVGLQHVLFKAFPTSINDIQVSWDDRNQLVRIVTNITFREWALDGGNTLLKVPSGTVISTQPAVPQTA